MRFSEILKEMEAQNWDIYYGGTHVCTVYNTDIKELQHKIDTKEPSSDIYSPYKNLTRYVGADWDPMKVVVKPHAAPIEDSVDPLRARQ